MLLAPLVRRTLAPAGQTPIFRQRGRHREKVSLIAALCVSSQQRNLSLHFRTDPKHFVNNERATDFLRDLLRQIPGRILVVWDQGGAHKGAPIRALCERFPRLELHSFPTYSPDLNPVEQLWSHLKYGRFCNYAPDTPELLNSEVRRYLHRFRHKQLRLRSLLAASELSFDSS